MNAHGISYWPFHSNSYLIPNPNTPWWSYPRYYPTLAYNHPLTSKTMPYPHSGLRARAPMLGEWDTCSSTSTEELFNMMYHVYLSTIITCPARTCSSNLNVSLSLTLPPISTTCSRFSSWSQESTTTIQRMTLSIMESTSIFLTLLKNQLKWLIILRDKSYTIQSFNIVLQSCVAYSVKAKLLFLNYAEHLSIKHFN